MRREFMAAVQAAKETLGWDSITMLKAAIDAAESTADRRGSYGSTDGYNLAIDWERPGPFWGPGAPVLFSGGCGYGSHVRALSPVFFEVASCGGHFVACYIGPHGPMWQTDTSPSRASWGDYDIAPDGGWEAAEARIRRLQEAYVRALEREP